MEFASLVYIIMRRSLLSHMTCKSINDSARSNTDDSGSFLNVLLTVLFLWPLGKSSMMNPLIRRVALRTLVASTIALATSVVGFLRCTWRITLIYHAQINMLILTLLHGQELGWVCLGSCGTDVLSFTALIHQQLTTSPRSL
jgi:hypothetical protein